MASTPSASPQSPSGNQNTADGPPPKAEKKAPFSCLTALTKKNKEKKDSPGGEKKRGLFSCLAKKDPKNVQTEEDGEALTENQTQLLIRRVALKFRSFGWTGAVEVRTTLAAPTVTSVFWLKQTIGLYSTNVTATTSGKTAEQIKEEEEERERERKEKEEMIKVLALAETEDDEDDESDTTDEEEEVERDMAKAFHRRIRNQLQQKIDWLRGRVSAVALELRDFRFTGLIGFSFTIGLDPSVAATLGINFGISFQIKVEIGLDSFVARVTSKEKTFLGELEGGDPFENHTKTVRKMVAALQATRLRLSYMGWNGSARAEMFVGTMSFYIQISFFKVATSVERQILDKREREQKIAELTRSQRQKQLEADAKGNPTIKPGSWVRSQSKDKPKDQQNAPPDANSSTAEDEPNGEATGNEREQQPHSVQRSNSGIVLGASRELQESVALQQFVDVDSEGANVWSMMGAVAARFGSALRRADSASQLQQSSPSSPRDQDKEAQKELKKSGFGRGLDSGIERIKRVAVGRSDGLYSGTRVGAQFNFVVFGFGIETRIEVETNSITPIDYNVKY